MDDVDTHTRAHGCARHIATRVLPTERGAEVISNDDDDDDDDYDDDDDDDDDARVVVVADTRAHAVE